MSFNGLWIKDLPPHPNGDKTYDFEFDDLDHASYYDLRFFYNNSFDIHKSITFRFFSGLKPYVRFTGYNAENFIFHSSNIDLSTDSWIGIYKIGKSNDWDNVIAWNWVNSIATVDIFYKTKIKKSSLYNNTKYEARLFYNNSFDEEATWTFQTPKVEIKDIYIDEGPKNITVKFDTRDILNKSATNDWMAIFKKGDQRTRENILAWSYIEDLNKKSVDITTDPALEIGSYDIVMFEDDSYSEMGSANLTIQGDYLKGTISLKNAKNVKISENDTRAYVSTSKGFEIYDIRDYKNMKLIGSVDVDEISDFKVSEDDNMVYLTSKTLGLVLIDIANPQSPKVINQLKIDELSEVNHPKLVISPKNKIVYLLGKIMVPYQYNENIKVPETKIISVDVADPQNLQFIDNHFSDYHQEGYSNIFISKDESILYLMRWKSYFFIDISNRNQYSVIDYKHWANNGINYDYISFDKTRIYGKIIRDNYDIATILDVSDPQNTTGGSIRVGIGNNIGSMTLSKDNKIFCTSQAGGYEAKRGLAVIDVSDINHKKILGIIKRAPHGKFQLSSDSRSLYISKSDRLSVLDISRFIQ